MRLIDFGLVIFDYEYYSMVVLMWYYWVFEVIFGELYLVIIKLIYYDVFYGLLCVKGGSD